MTDASFTELGAVLAVAQHKSFRAAARQLDISPSALSHAIAALERRLGARLFQRTTRSVGLTAAGAQLVRRVSPALSEISSALEAAQEQSDEPSGALRITTSRGAVHFGAIELITELRTRYPKVEVEISTQERLVDIVAEGYDAGVRLAEAVPLDMVAVPFGPDLSMAVVGAPRYFARRQKPRVPADLLKHECIRRRLSDGTVYRWDLEKRGRELKVDVRGAVTLDDDAMVIQAAGAGLGLAFVSAQIVDQQLRDGELLRVMDDWTPAFAGLRIFHPGGRHVRPALRAFLDLVKERNQSANANAKRARPNPRGSLLRGGGVAVPATPPVI